MNKKKKKIIRYSVIIGVIVVALAVVVVLYATRDTSALQYNVENRDEMEFNPYITNEERLDNSFLEYGKVLTKYSKMVPTAPKRLLRPRKTKALFMCPGRRRHSGSMCR